MEQKNAEELIAELRALLQKTDFTSMMRANEIMDWLDEHSDDEEVGRIYYDYVETYGIADLELNIENIRKQMIADQTEGSSQYEYLRISSSRGQVR